MSSDDRPDLLESVVAIGDVNEVLTVVSRLQDFLPEYGKTGSDKKFSELWKETERLEREYAAARQKMREYAAQIVAKARANWTREEIEKATGYR